MPTPSKECIGCGEIKPLSAFYRHKMMADGHLGRCIECVKEGVRLHRLANLDRVREYDRQRDSLPHRIELRRKVVGKYDAQFPERRRAVSAVNNAVRDGKLRKWPACAVPECECTRVVAHHCDYSRPLDVVWLCQAHHKQAHALLKGV